MDYSEKNKSYNSAISLVSASNSFEMNVMGITRVITTTLEGNGIQGFFRIKRKSCGVKNKSSILQDKKLNNEQLL